MSPLLSFLFIFTTFFFSEDWKLVKEIENIQVYIRKPVGAKYEQVKIISKTQSRLSEIVRALEDVEHHKDWVYATSESSFLSKSSNTQFDYYVTMDMPFPVKDRDVTIRYQRIQQQDKKVLINSKAVIGLKQNRDGFVRIVDFNSSYKLTPLDNGWVEIEYFMKVDPGGKLPAWVVNLFTTKGPMETMKSLFKLLESGYYEDVIVDGIVE